MINAPLKKLETALHIFLEQYFSPTVSTSCAEVILWAEHHNKLGQGLLKLLGTEPLQSVKPDGEVELQEKFPVSALIQGNKQPSFYVAQLATETAIKKAKKNGMSIVGANGFFSSTGPLGFYADKAARENLISIVVARSPGAVIPFETKIPFFGTNPIAFGFPTESDPILFDMATSAITWYELVFAKMKGRQIPDGIAIGPDGHFTTDPEQAMSGGILPFDNSHKGSGLSMMVELLSGPLVGSAYCDCETFNKDWGFLIICISPEVLVGTEIFKKQSSDLIQTIKQKSFAKNGKEAVLPGETSHQHALKVAQRGWIEIEDEVAVLLKMD